MVPNENARLFYYVQAFFSNLVHRTQQNDYMKLKTILEKVATITPRATAFHFLRDCDKVKGSWLWDLEMLISSTVSCRIG